MAFFLILKVIVFIIYIKLLSVILNYLITILSIINYKLKKRLI